jgi:uncharacterized protein (DUF2236 family)
MTAAALPRSADPGLFGPDSVTWRVQGDPAMLVGGFRALLIQACHPLVMQGFELNSAWRDDPWGRLDRTGRYVATVAFGTTADAETAGARLRTLHRRLKGGVDPDTGRRFRVDDPDLLLWVHVTEVDSFLTGYRRSGGRLSDEEADRYVDEMRVAARLVGLDPEEAPRSVAGIDSYYQETRSQLRVTPAAWRNLWFGLNPPMPTWVSLATPARPLWAALMATSAGMLPRWARRLYRLPGLPPGDLAADVAARAIRQALLAAPAAVRGTPPRQAAMERLGLTG